MLSRIYMDRKTHEVKNGVRKVAETHSQAPLITK
jgi:hypothetical protein